MKHQGIMSKMFSCPQISNRQAGGGFLKGDLVRCKYTHRLGVIVNAYYDVRIIDLTRMIRLDVQFPTGDVEIFSPNELEFLESSD